MKPTSVLAGIGLGVAVLVIATYLLYMIGLILVLRRLGKLSWIAFIPLLNYLAQVRAINAPKRWFVFAFVPYVGVIYAGSVAIRLGAIFGEGPSFSLFWLTLGAPVGMFLLALPNRKIDRKLLEKPTTLLDIKHIRKHLKQSQ